MKEKKPDTDWQKMNEIFSAAIQLEAVEQSDFLQIACGGDAGMRREIEEILSASRRAEREAFLAEDALLAGTKILAATEIEKFTAGKIIGKYKIIREIGRGGMGTVFLASRDEADFRQTVALKIVKRGMDTDAILRRFRLEREVLAALNHPNIARLLDGGTTGDGLPFLVMEYVEGVSVTEFCDSKKLGIEERLRLFRKICAAVAHAHQNLVVHRDIKPSNILVTADGEPKLLDFGISKLLGTGFSDTTVEQTAAESRLMTPEYASPEQITGGRITTVSDIYSLGVLLYELLSGHRPFNLKNRPSPEILKIVAEAEPPAPSTVAVTAGEIFKGETMEILSPATIADARGANQPERLRRRLTGDLDNIVLMSLRKEPSCRYSSVEQFSEDLRRHLEGLPVLARPQTFSYRAAKFFARNRAAVAFASIALVGILAGLSIAAWQAVEASRERIRAERRFEEVRNLANTLISGWDKDIPESLVSNQVRGRIADISSEYLDNLARETNDAALLKELARAYITVGHNYTYQYIHEEKAKKSLRKAEAIARLLIADAPGDVEAKRLLAECLGQYDGYFGERDRAESLKNRAEIIRIHEEILEIAPDDEKTLYDLAGAYALYGLVLKFAGRGEESSVYYARAVEITKRRVAVLEKTAATPEDRAKLASTYIHLADNQAEQLNDAQSALENLRRAAAITDALLSENPENETAMLFAVTAAFQTGLVLKKTGDFRASLEAFQRTAQFARAFLNRNYGNGYFIRKEYDSLLESAESLYQLGETDAALTFLRQSFDLRRKWTERDKESLRTYGGHAYLFNAGGKLLVRMKRFDEALDAFREAEAAHLKILAGEPNQISNRRNLATLYLTLGDFHAGTGVCGFERAKNFDAISESYEYCPPDANGFKSNRASLREANEFYKKAARLLDEFGAEGLAIEKDKENLRLANEKIRLTAES